MSYLYFAGRRLVRPQAYTKIDDTGMVNRSIDAANTLAIIGECTGGEPGVVHIMQDPAYGKGLLRSGDLVTALERAFDPSADIPGAYNVLAIRVNPATQATKVFEDASANDVLTLTSVDYGAWVNQIKAKIESGTTSGKKITITYGGSYDSGDNIEKASFFVANADTTATSCTVTVNTATGVLTITSDGVGGTFNVTLANYPTIQELVDYLDSQTFLEAGVLTSSPDADLSTELDELTATSLLTNATTTDAGYDPAIDGTVLPLTATTGFVVGGYLCINNDTNQETRRIVAVSAAVSVTMDAPLSTTYSSGAEVVPAVELQADLQALIDWVNGGNTEYVTAAFPSTGTIRTLPTDYPDTYLTGGGEGTTAQSHWDAALDLLKTQDAHIITVVTPDASVHASLSTHVSYMSTTGKKERIGVVGGFDTADGYTNGLGSWTSTALINSSIAQMKTYCANLNSDRMVYVGPGMIYYDENGDATTFPGHIAAAMAAGMKAGVDVAEPLTHKTFKAIGLEYNLRPAQIDDLLEAGCCVLEYAQGRGYRIAQSLTTWLKDEKYNRVEWSVRATADYVARQVRERLENEFVGQKALHRVLISIKNAVDSVLRQMVRLELLAGDEDNPPYKNIIVRLEGTVAWVDFECSPVLPINYIPITVHLTTFTATVAA
jgi:hypothetical protein